MDITKKDSVSNKEDWWDQLTDAQKESIQQGIKDIEEGRVQTHAYVMREYSRFL